MMSRGSWIPLFFASFLLLGTLDTGKCYKLSPVESTSEEELAWREFQEFREWRKTRKNDWKEDSGSLRKDENSLESFELRKQKTNPSETNRPAFADPPPIDEPALMGRYIVNQADWTTVATISTREDMPTFPTANVISMSDGPIGSGSGIPYMFLTPLDFTAKDLAHDDRASLLVTLAQGSYCKGQGMDPMDPRCARIILAGKIQRIGNSSSDYEFAKKSVFGRHPWLAHMPADHHFFFAKLNIGSIAVLDTFGGPKYISVEDYMNPPSPKNPRKHHHHHHHHRLPNWPEVDMSIESEERFAYRV